MLFKNHPDLLRDFTYFLPDAVQESVSVWGAEGDRPPLAPPPLHPPPLAQAKDRIQRMAEANRQRDAQMAAQQAQARGADRVSGALGAPTARGEERGHGAPPAAPSLTRSPPDTHSRRRRLWAGRL